MTYTSHLFLPIVNLAFTRLSSRAVPNCVKEPIKIEDEVIHETDKSLVIWPKDYAFGFTMQLFFFFIISGCGSWKGVSGYNMVILEEKAGFLYMSSSK